MTCSAWAIPTRNVRGWKAPCYLIGETHIPDWETFWKDTNWEYWESRVDDKCRNCKMHSGFEHSAVTEAMKTMKGKLQLAAWSLSK